MYYAQMTLLINTIEIIQENSTINRNNLKNALKKVYQICERDEDKAFLHADSDSQTAMEVFTKGCETFIKTWNSPKFYELIALINAWNDGEIRCHDENENVVINKPQFTKDLPTLTDGIYVSTDRGVKVGVYVNELKEYLFKETK